MKHITLVGYLVLILSIAKAQTFNSATGVSIPPNTSTCVPVAVSGVGVISGSYGLEQVCIDLSITDADNVYISLQSPDGNEYFLSYIEYSSGADYSITCFNSSSASPIWLGSPPFNGSYQPETNLGAFNNDQDADGTWYICFDNNGSYTGTLNSGSLLFSNSPSTSCGSVANDNCNSSPLICDFNGYCGTTSASYTVGAGEGTSISGCGFSLDNNSWVEFVPNNTSVSIDVVVEDCENSDGVQFGVWESSDCSSFTNLDCAPSNPFIGTQTMNFTGLTAGVSYYLMIDGYAGDVCNYSFTVSGGSGVSVVEILEGDAIDACVGDDVALSVPNLPGVTYTWNWGSSTGTGTSITVPNVSPPIIVSVNSAGICNNQSDQISINLQSNCCGANSGQWE